MMLFRSLVSLLVALTTASAVSGQPTDAPRVDGTGTSLAAPAPLPFFYDLYTFRGERGATAVVAAFAVPVGELETERDNGVRYRFDVSLVLSDTAVGSVTRTDDSVYVSVPRRLSRDHLLFTHVEIEAPPSSSTLQRVIMTDAAKSGVGQLYGAPFPVPDYRGTHLMLSDIALGQPGTEGGWTRGDVTLALLPTSQFPGSSFDVYYEIYNLGVGETYSTQISIQPVDDSGADRTDEGSTVRTRFSGEAATGADGTQAELRRVEASLSNGRYRLTVTVTDEATGQTATRARLLRVRESGRGLTLVPALPASRIASRGAG